MASYLLLERCAFRGACPRGHARTPGPQQQLPRVAALPLGRSGCPALPSGADMPPLRLCGAPQLPKRTPRQQQDGERQVRCSSSSSTSASQVPMAAPAAAAAPTSANTSSEASTTRSGGRPGGPMPAAPFASITRVLLIGQPGNLVRQLAGRRVRVAGPVSLLFFLAGLILAIISAVRAVLVRRAKACQCCRGYGIVRCRLCGGEGTVAWMAKNLHQEMCPLCMTRRFVACPDCGGHHHKKMFSHIQATPARNLVPDFLG